MLGILGPPPAAEMGTAGQAAVLAWEQDDQEVVVALKAPGATARDASCFITSTSLVVTASGARLVEGELSFRVDPEESFWTLEGTGEERSLVVTLAKARVGRRWPSLTKHAAPSPSPALPTAMAAALLPIAATTVDRPSNGSVDAGATLPIGLLDVTSCAMDGGGEEEEEEGREDAKQQQSQEIQLEARFVQLRAEKGLDDDSTLDAFFALFNIAIQLYHLNKLAAYLVDVHKLEAAVKLFHEMEDIMGKNAALCENIAHTYNSLGNYETAERYFRESLQFIEAGCSSGGAQQGNRGGVLLGLGLVRDRLERPAEALPILEQAYEFYQRRAQGQPASLLGKVAVSCAMVERKLGNQDRAEKYIREAITTYEITCGETSPLTGSAYFKLGQILWDRRARQPARTALRRAYELEVIKDAFTIVGVLEIHNLVMDTFLKDSQSIERKGFADFLAAASQGFVRVQRDTTQDGNAAVYYKAVAEMRTWGGAYAEAITAFELAIQLFRQERSQDCTHFIEECEALRSFSQRNLEGAQSSPMVLETCNVTDGAATKERKVDT